MANVCYKRGIIQMMDAYETTDIEYEIAVDIIISHKVLFPSTDLAEKPQTKKGLYSFGKTLLIDLRRTEQEIFLDIHKNARYKINRAMKRDPLIYHELTTPTNQEIQQFVRFFNDFALNKGIPPAIIDRLKGLRDYNSLILSYVSNENGDTLCYHAYVKTKNSCALLHSASARFNNSELRNMIGRANRYLHWEDIKSFKRMGLDWFDFGGIFVEPLKDGERHINTFKMEFGGQIVDIDRRHYPNTILGKIIVFLFWLKHRNRPEFLRAKRLRQHQYALKS